MSRITEFYDGKVINKIPVHLIIAAILTILVMIIYLSLLSNSFNGDGLGYSYIVEKVTTQNLFSVSARLLFCPTGRLFHKLASSVGYNVRSVYVLETMNAIFGAMGVGLFFLTAFSLGRNIRLALLVSLGLAFSFSFWFWNANTTSYPPNVFFLLCCLFLLVLLLGIEQRKRYFIYSLLIGLFHALANFYWLTAILLAPSIALAIFIAVKNYRFSERLKATFIYSASFLFFLFTLLLIAGIKTAGVKTPVEFFAWLSSASHGIRPDLSLLNFSRGIIGFSSSVFMLTQIGPAVKQFIWGVPFPLESEFKLYMEIIIFILLWVFLLFSIFYGYVYRKEIFKDKNRFGLILLAWAVPVTFFGLIFLGSDTERWLAILPVLWLFLLSVALHAKKYLKPAKATVVEIFICIFVFGMFTHNAVFGIIPGHNPDKNQYMKSARFISTQISREDLVLLWGHDHVFTADHLRYFFDLEAIHLNQLAKESKYPETIFGILDETINRCRRRGGRVFIIGRLFLVEDLPESSYSQKEQKVSRETFVLYFSQWERNPAFNYGKDTYWELLGKGR